MAIGWLTVLKMVPWGDVIANAPKIADGAVKLWSTVAKKQAATVSPTTNAEPAPSSEAQSIVILQAKLATAEAQISELHNQMLKSSELIKALAEQNTQLIKRVELNRVRVLWLAGIVAAVVVITAITLAITFAG
jgi:uncharacterized protein (DUF697 family)